MIKMIKEKCPFEEYHYKPSGTMIQDMDDTIGDTEAYRCNVCALIWPTEEAKRQMWLLGK